MESYVIELEKGCYRARWQGDPGRTLNLQSAKVFDTKRGAMVGLAHARTWSPFVDAEIVPVRICLVEEEAECQDS